MIAFSDEGILHVGPMLCIFSLYDRGNYKYMCACMRKLSTKYSWRVLIRVNILEFNFTITQCDTLLLAIL